MKRIALAVALAAAIVVAFCNAAKSPVAIQSEASATLPFKPEAQKSSSKKIASPDIDKPAETKTVRKQRDDYSTHIDTLFDRDSIMARAYATFRKELPIARDKDMEQRLFSEFAQCPAFSVGKDIVSAHRPVLKKWIADALAEKNEVTRTLYAQYIGYFKTDERRYRNFYIETNQMRPGEDIKVRGYNYHYDDGASKKQVLRADVEIARLTLDKQLKPSGFTITHRDTARFSGYDDTYRKKMTEPGVYRVTISTESQFVQQYMQVSWLDCVVKSDARTIVVFGSSYRDTLAPPYTVHFIDSDGEVFTTPTDKQGVCALKHLFGQTAQLATMKVILEKDGQLAFMDGRVPYQQRDTSMEFHLYTDRPVYRPGSRVHFRGMVKLAVDARWIAPAAIDSVVFRLTDPQGSQIWMDTLAVDQWGHFGDSIEIAESNKQGRYTIQYYTVRNADSKKRVYSTQGYRQQATFLIDSYKKPEFLITVKPEKETYLADEEAVIKVKGEYYFGGALADVPVKVRWHRQTMGHYFSSWGESRCVFYPSGGRVFVKQEDLKLNKNGELTLKWKAGAEAGVAYGYMIAEVIATDQSRREVREEAKVQIVKHDAYLAILPDKYEYEIGETARLEVVAVDMKGAALSGSLGWRTKKDKGIIDDRSITIPASGRVHVDVAIKEAGTYTFEATAKDRQGKVAFIEYSVRSVKKRSWDWDWERIEISTDRKSYSVGDTARISVKAGADSTRVFCSVEGQRLNAWSVPRLKEHALEYVLPITAELGVNVQFSVVFSGRERMAYNTHAFTVIDSSVLLRVKLDGARTLKPGERFTGTVRVTDRSGKPVKAAMSVGLVDEAIYDVAKLLEKANVYGYNYNNYYRYRREGAPEGVLGIMPPWYGNRVYTAYNQFDPRFITALEGVADATMQAAAPAAEMMSKEESRAAGGAGAAKKMAAPSASRAKSDLALKILEVESEQDDDSQEQEEPPRERKDFKDLGYWNPSFATDAQGKGTLSFVMPDDLTKWRLVMIGSDGATHLLEMRDSLITRQDIMAKLQAPRGFVVDDSAVVATVLHNYSPNQIEAKVTLEIKAGAANAQLRCEPVQKVAIPPNGTKRVDWPVRITRAGKVTFATTVTSAAGSDAESRTYPIRVRGIPQTVSQAGVLSENDPQTKVDLPSPQTAAPGSRTLTIEYAPTLAFSMFETLEYLTGYPYGCVEQTMSRFLPNLYVASVLKRLGLQNDSLAKMIPVYTKKGLERLKQLQHGDGGWGWWANDKSDPRMTALVVHGLGWAVNTEIDPKDKVIAQEMLDRGASAALSQMRSEKEIRDVIMLAHSLVAGKKVKEAAAGVTNAYNQRGKLTSYELALLLECLVALGKTAEATKVVELLETKVTNITGAAFWGGNANYYWNRQDEEATARVVRALVDFAPGNALIPKAVSWLGRQKRDGYWVSTKTSAVVVEALSHYLQKTGEFDPDYQLTIVLNGKTLVTQKVTKASLKNWKGRIELPDSLIGERNDLELRMNGSGRLYWNTHLRYATSERPVVARNNGIEITREYTRLVYRQKQDGDWEVAREKFDGALKGGDELEVSIKVKNVKPYEFLLVEDYFPSGMEVLHKPQDWYSRWCGWWWSGYTHKEARDDRMVFFVTYLGNGERVFSYLLRAETPGVFVGLPARAELMYEPEVSGNSAETEVRISDPK